MEELALMSDNGPDRLVYRVSEVCAMLGISRATLYRRVKTGEITIHKLGSISFVKREGLDRLLETLKEAAPQPDPRLGVRCGVASSDGVRRRETVSS